MFGYRVSLDLKDYIQRMMYLGAFEREETRVVKNRLRSGATFVDVGANAGYFSLLASRLVGPSGRVLSFEPSPYVAKLLAGTLSQNRIQNVQLFPFALGRSNSQGVLSDVLPDNHSPTFFLPGSGSAVDICVLDEVLERTQTEQVDLMKVDVEGFEGEVLRGAEKSIQAGRIKAVLVEFNERWLRAAKTSSQEIHQWLTERNFTCKDLLHTPAQTLVNRLYVHTPK